MDQLERVWKFALRHWRALSMRQQRWAQLTIVAAGLLIATWGLVRATPTYTWLLSGREFSARELTALEAAFGQAGLNGYVVQQRRVRVPRDQRASYVGALAEANALPMHFDLELKDELRRFSPFESQEQRRARLQVTQQRELALILRAMKGIEDATVQLDQSVTGPFQRQRRMTAMVVVRPRPEQPLDMAMVRSIRHLVAASKVDLTPADVTVTDLETGLSFGSRLDDPALARADELALRRMSYERDWRHKLERLLTFIPGVQVAVNVDVEYRVLPAGASADPSVAAQQILAPSATGVSIGIPDRFYEIAWREQQRGLPRIERRPWADDIQSEFRESQDERVRQLVQSALPADAVVAIHAFDDSLARGVNNEFWSRWPGALGWQSSLLGALSITVLATLIWSVLRPQRSPNSAAGSRHSVKADQHASTGDTLKAAADGARTSTAADARHADDARHSADARHADYHQELTRMVRRIRTRPPPSWPSGLIKPLSFSHLQSDAEARVTHPASDQQIQDVAQLVRSLDPETAETLLRRFAPELSRRIRQAAAQLDELPNERKRQISADFCEVLRGAEDATTTDSDVPACPAPVVSTAADSATEQPTDSPQAAAADQLAGGSLDQLAELLRKEHPQTIAAVLTTLIPQRAARLILALSPGQQYEVVRRIAQMDRTDLESLVEIERELQDQLKRADDRQQVARNGWQAVQSILLSADATSRHDIMVNLSRFDVKLADRLRGSEGDAEDGDPQRHSHYMTAVAFDRLADLDQEVLAHVVRLVPHETMIRALAGASHTCLKDLLDKLPAEDAARLRMDLAAIGPLRLGDIHQAQALLVTTARQVVDTSALSTGDRLRVSA